MTVDEGCEYFENISNIRSKLLTLKKVGLVTLKLVSKLQRCLEVKLKELN